MVCPKLEKGTCTLNKNKCGKKYEVKMQKYSTCSVFKRKNIKTKTKNKNRKANKKSGAKKMVKKKSKNNKKAKTTKKKTATKKKFLFFSF